jgi:hypothetical protein
VHLPTFVSLGIIALVIAVAVVASLRADARDHRNSLRDPQDIDVDSLDDPGGVDPSRDRPFPVDQESPRER